MNLQRAPLLLSWLAFQHAADRDSGSAEYNELFWAFQEVDELCRTSPNEAWEFILSAWKADQSKVIAEILSAGPLEDLLAKHGDTVIDRVEVMAKEDSTFAFLLGGVWRNEMTDAVWSRVLAVRDRHGWDGIPPATSDVE
jgi:hypothetical protein